MAKFIVAHVHSVVLGDERVLTNGLFVESIDQKHLTFDPARMQADYAVHRNSDQKFVWNLNPHALRAFRVRESDAVEPATAVEDVCLTAGPTARV